ncbi:unannotated protein [freshwater metagenome]|uniref:Unannotated protein n=1 Tax=freshwater metagenome TaxID=449393 RepID=A0A6J6Y9R1_9ZZZZ
MVAARDPVSTVSASSLPGSRKWVCKSTNPGSINLEPTSTPPSIFVSETSLITPFSIFIEILLPEAV